MAVFKTHAAFGIARNPHFIFAEYTVKKKLAIVEHFYLI